MWFNKIIQALVIIFLYGLMMFFIDKRLTAVEKARCEQWKWDVCGEVIYEKVEVK